MGRARVRIHVTLAERLLAGADPEALRRRLRAALAVELARLELPATVVVAVETGAGRVPVRLAVQRRALRYPPELLRRAWESAGPGTPAPAPAPGWLADALDALPQGERARTLADVLEALVVTAVRRAPAALVDGPMAAAYVDAIGDGEAVPGVAWPRVLRTLVALRGDLAGPERVVAAVLAARAMGADDLDAAESAFSALRDPTVGLAADPATLARVAGRKVDAPLRLRDASDAWRRRLDELDGELFARLGVALPEVWLQPLPDPRAGRLTPTVCGVPDLPLRLPATEADVAAAVVAAVGRGVVENRTRLLSLEDLDRRLALLRTAFPEVVRAVSQSCSLADVLRTLRVLVAERIPVANLLSLLSCLLDVGGHADAGQRAERFRAEVAGVVASQLLPAGGVPVIAVASGTEERLADGAGLDDAEVERLHAELDVLLAPSGSDGPAPVVVTTRAARRPLRSLLADERPELFVLAQAELPRRVRGARIGTLDAAPHATPEASAA